jgi:hypothetical protein
MTARAPRPGSALDIRLILETPLRLFVAWLAMVLLVTWAGYPGVICVTPFAWITATAVGQRCAARSSNPTARGRLLEAALAGAFFGLLQGVLFAVFVPALGPLRAEEQASALGISLGIVCAGVPVAAGLAAVTAWLAGRRAGIA